jgi:hypothetical protein
MYKYIYIHTHILSAVITHEVCTTETHLRMLKGEGTATVRKISTGTETGPSVA